MEREHNTMSSTPTQTSPTPTTFVQADTATFRELVQKLTGAAPSDCIQKLPVTTLPTRLSSKFAAAAAAAATNTTATPPRRSPFKLQERRHTMRKLEIKLGLTSLRNSSPSHYSERQTHRVDSPIQSPVTPLGSESLFLSTRVPGPGSGSGSESESPVSEEERAIAEKGFYFHPSPLSTPRGSDPPELLALFPLSSPSERTRE